MKLLWISLFIVAALAEGEGETENHHAGLKTFHWLMALGMQLIVPSVATSFAIAERSSIATILQISSAAYTIFDTLFLSFPDMDGVENRTSRGTGVFLMFVSCGTALTATLNSGSMWFKGSGKREKWIAKVGESVLNIFHKVLSAVTTLVGWVKVCLAPVALFGFCRDRHTGQCIAHGIMGSAFIVYGFVMLTLLVVPWLRQNQGKYSQEFYDSTVMCAWGIVNTFTEHRWGREPWSHGDYQHTSMGIIWWCGGLLGMWLTRNGQRSFIPALLLIFTGYAMSQHSQHLMISTKVHAMFGLVLMSGGLCRIVEISFLLKDERFSKKGIASFQYIPSFSLVLSGILFMSANEQQLMLVDSLGADHSSYIMVVTSAAFMTYLWLCLLVDLYLKMVERVYTPLDFEMDDLSESVELSE